MPPENWQDHPVRKWLYNTTMELIRELPAVQIGTPFELSYRGYFPATGMHSVLFTALWSGHDLVAVTGQAGVELLFETKLPKRRRFLPYFVLRPAPKGSFKWIYIQPDFGHVTEVSVGPVDDPLVLTVADAEIAALAENSNAPLYGA